MWKIALFDISLKKEEHACHSRHWKGISLNKYVEVRGESYKVYPATIGR